ncbi:MAG: addiction module protein [Acidobacteria bacterium]|nr:addiction module protein [Acidobacteriota bacterium]
MTSRAQAVLRDALDLPVDERADLAAELLASLDGDGPEDQAAVEEAWAKEIERRARRVMSGESQGIPWEEVRVCAESALRKS